MARKDYVAPPLPDSLPLLRRGRGSHHIGLCAPQLSEVRDSSRRLLQVSWEAAWRLGPVYLDLLRFGLDYSGWGEELGWK